jgi:hypothetical protein
MARKAPEVYFPIRNLIASLVPITLVAWYFSDKLGRDSTPVKFAVVGVAVLLQIAIVVVSTRTRHSRRPFFWAVYDLLTGDGRLPLRLLTNALIVVVLLALSFDVAGLAGDGGLPSSFISRFVEVDLYWVLANFLGISVSNIRATGASQFLTVITTICGLMFWSMFISILVNKHLRLRDMADGRMPGADVDKEHYNE